MVLYANGDSLKQIPFPATLTGPTSGTAPDYVYKESDQAVASAWAHFMKATKKTTSKPSAKSTSSSSGSKNHSKAHHHARPSIDTSDLVADPADGIAQAKGLTPDMPVYYPRYILSGSQYCTSVGDECLNGDEPAAAYAHSYPRQYRVTTTTGKHVHAYFMTIAISPLLGEYYGIQGVHWTDPLLSDTLGGDGEGVQRHVGW